jgi:putative ATPase
VRAGKIGQVPPHLRDAHYPGSKTIEHGSGYTYSHDEPFGIAEQQYAPDVVLDAEYYRPTTLGAEAGFRDRWERIRRMIRGR